jgi:hypothetical protein
MMNDGNHYPLSHFPRRGSSLISVGEQVGVGVIGDLGGEWEKEGDLEGRLEALLGVEVAVAKGILTLVHCSLIRGLVARGHVCVYVSPVRSPLPLVFF